VAATEPMEPQGDSVAIGKAVAFFVGVAASCAAAGYAISAWLIPAIERASR